MQNVDWERGVKVLAKGSKERTVPIGDVARQAMLRSVDAFRPKPAREDVDNVFLPVDGYPLTVNAIIHIMSRLAKNTGGDTPAYALVAPHIECHLPGRRR